MIKKNNYIYQFLYYSSQGKYDFTSFFPLFSIVIGTIVILLTIGVMEGMERSIFRKMESFHFSYTGKLNDDIFFGSPAKNLSKSIV